MARNTIKPQRGYQAVRYNAVSHGILSRHTVLPHEDKEEFSMLLNALIVEHDPSGPTEMILTEDLAAIIWRKRRVLQAENSSINKNLARTVRNPRTVLASSVPFEQDLWNEETDLINILTQSKECANTSLEESNHALACARKALELFDSDPEVCYTQLPPMSG